MSARHHLLHLDVILPERGLARVGVVLSMIVGAAVAVLVPVVVVLMVLGMLQGE